MMSKDDVFDCLNDRIGMIIQSEQELIFIIIIKKIFVCLLVWDLRCYVCRLLGHVSFLMGMKKNLMN